MAVVFHLSDLHIGPKFLPKQPLLDGLSCHNVEVWSTLRGHLLDRISAVAGDYRVVISGDLSWKGDVEALDLASQLVFEGSTDRSVDDGLQLPRDKCIVVPGNHDAYGGRYLGGLSLRNFHAHFPQSQDYPLRARKYFGDVSLAFVGFDSTFGLRPCTLAKRLGRGQIQRAQYLLASGFLSGVEADFRVAILHHNPVFPPTTAPDWNLLLEGGRGFLKWVIENRVDVVLFGHIHDDYYDVLPLKSLVRLLPRNRGNRRFFRSFRLGTNVLADYPRIRLLDNKTPRQLDILAYHWINMKRRKDKKDPLLAPGELSSKAHFERVLHGAPEYPVFLEELRGFSAAETALIMAGSACQHNDQRKNSYLELDFSKQDGHRVIKVRRHLYSPSPPRFVTKETVLTFAQ